jgi:hypothetical protein
MRAEDEAEDAEKILLYNREERDSRVIDAYLAPITDSIEWINTRLDAIEAFVALSDADIIEATMPVYALLNECADFLVERAMSH